MVLDCGGQKARFLNNSSVLSLAIRPIQLSELIERSQINKSLSTLLIQWGETARKRLYASTIKNLSAFYDAAIELANVV